MPSPQNTFNTRPGVAKSEAGTRHGIAQSEAGTRHGIAQSEAGTRFSLSAPYLSAVVQKTLA